MVAPPIFCAGYRANRSATASAHLPPKYPSCRGVTQDLAQSFSGQHGQPKYISRNARQRPPKADIPSCIAHVRFFKADMTFCSGRRRTGVASPAPLHILDLPTAAKVTLIAPSVAPNRTGVRIHGRCRKYARRRIDRIFINYHWRRRYNDRPANHDGLRLLDNDRRRSPVLVGRN